LVLGRVRAPVQTAVLNPGVVAGGQGVEAEGAGPGQQPDHLDPLVAAGAGVGGAAAGVLGGEVVDHRPLELLGHVPHVERDAEGVGDPAGGTRRASSASARVQQPLPCTWRCPGVSASFRCTPVTSQPASTASAAATEESTPPLIATSTWSVTAGLPERRAPRR